MNGTIRQILGLGVVCLMLAGVSVGQERPGQTTVATPSATETLVEHNTGGDIDLSVLRAMIEDVRPAATPSAIVTPDSDRGPVGPLPAAPILDAASTRVNVQALLTDNQGEPLPGPTVDLSFSLYNSGGGVVQGPFTLNNVPIDNGIINVQVPVSAASFNGDYRELGMSVDGGAELSPRVRLSAVPYAYRVDRVASEELDDAIILGGPGANGELTVYNHSFAQRETVKLDGINNHVATFLDDGALSARMGGHETGRISLRDDGTGESNDQTILLDAGLDSGGRILLADTDGDNHLSLTGDAGTVNVEDSVNVFEELNGELNATLRRTGFGGQLLVTDPTGTDGVLISGNPLTGGGIGEFYQGDGSIGVQILADAVSGSVLGMHSNSGAMTISLDSEDVNSGGALATFKNSNNDTTIALNADVSDAGRIRLRNADEQVTLQLDANGNGQNMGRLTLSDSDSPVVELFSHSNLGSCLEMSDIDGTNTVSIYSSWSGGEDGGGRLIVRDADGTTAFDANAETGVTKTRVLEITGGADLSEQFDVGGGEASPGTVVCIDPANAGQLIVCDQSYDRTVAGIVSGAGGVKTGMMMGQRDSVADGALPVALTGRVYVQANTSAGAIQPGDLLTTSGVPGFAMKVTDHGRAQGAIIGKAMTELCDGTGLVLVLVSLQ